MMTMEDKFEIKSGAPINDIDRPIRNMLETDVINNLLVSLNR
jgi:hypothetical protein